MNYSLCARCLSLGYCKNSTRQLVRDAQLEDAEYLRDLRNFAASLEVSADHWLDYLMDMYRDFSGRIVSNGQDVFLDTEVFETDSIREWLRDWACASIPDHVRPRLREESRERIRVLATILSTRFPFEAGLWGVRAANDNRPPSTER